PKFYATYCTSETANALTQALNAIDTAIENEAAIETLDGLKSQLEEAVNGVKFKSDSKITQIYVATDKGDGTSYGTSLTKAIGYVPVQLTVVGTDGSVMASDLSWAGQIKVRGNMTAGGAKKPYNMKFSSKVDLFGFGKAKKWCLLADYYEPSLMRNKIALDIAERLGITTMAHQHVEVWVDGAYRGMYLLTEKIEADDNRVNIKTKNGDFLVELDEYSKTEMDIVHFMSSLGHPFRLHEPEKEEQAATVKQKIDNFEKLISSGKWEQVKASADIDSFVSFYIVNEYMKNSDFVYKSIYYYYKDGKFYGGPAWDFDWSSGNNKASIPTEGAVVSGFHYYKYLAKFPEFQLAVSEKIAQISDYIAGIYTDNVGIIDGTTSYYSDAISRNYKIWSFVGTGRKPDSTYKENVAYFKNWLKSRHEWMTDYFLNRIYISSESFPDSNFLAYLKTLDTNNNSFLDSSELKAITSINVSGKNIASLKGIELFPALEELDCTHNPALTQVDISECLLLFLRNIAHDSGTTITGGTKPEFTGHSLLLSGQIGLDFYIMIPDELVTNDAYMQFTVNGEAQTPAMLHNADDLGEGKYRFTCFINSVQMADKVTAELHCGDNQTFTHTYRVKDYTDKALEVFPAESNDIRTLIMAIKDYGHYVQPPLAANNKWTLGVKHNVMDCSDSDIASDSADVKATLAGYAMQGSSEGSGIEGMSCSLTLDSETAINIYLTPKTGYTGSVYAYLDGSNENVAVKQSDGKYLVNISGISAHMLGDTYKIRVNAGGEFTVRVSALSYANAAMNSSSTSNDMKKAAIALYKYYDATMNYRASPEYKPY
ncbi:MAG: CotH kinase family protein, partial [Synergistaceae bacterium]|nr:CotH kinase family protein [Synergistaceae bacterium]